MREFIVKRKELAGKEICQSAKILYYQTILPRIRMRIGFSVKVTQNFDVIRNLSRYGARPIQIAEAFLLTARQYGEVVLPDPAPTEASGAAPGRVQIL